MKKYLSLIFMLMLAMQSVFAQDEKSFTAKGVVVDANNEPIIGATVVIQDKPGQQPFSSLTSWTSRG